MKKSKIWIAVLLAAVVLIGIGGVAVYFFTQEEEELPLVDTRISEEDLGAQFVKYQLLPEEYTEQVVEVKEGTGKNIVTDITKTEAAAAKTLAVDTQLKQEMESGNYTLENPLVVTNPYQNSPLTAVIVYSGGDSTAVRVTVKGKEKEQDISDVLEASDQHMIPVIGLYADTENEVLIEEVKEDGTVTAYNTVMIQTDSLPDRLQNIVTLDQKEAESSAQLLLITGLETPYIYAIDSNGDIRWYLNSKGKYYGLYPLSNGHFLLEDDETMMLTSSTPNSSQLQEIDMIGRVYMDYFFENGVHHDIMEKTPGGNLFIVSNSGRGYEQDLIQEIDRETGAVVRELDLKEVLKGISYIDSDDWAHINTVSYQEETDSIIISPRNLHSGIKINWTTGEIIWILSNPKFYEGTGLEDKVLKPDGEFQWHYQQHTVYQLEEDLDNNPDTIHVALYDNHSQNQRKVKYYDNTNASYVKIYTIDEKAKTVKLDKSYESIFSRITSNYILNHDAGRIFSVGATVDIKKNGIGGRIYEYDFESGQVLNQYSLAHNFYRGYQITVDTDNCLGEIDASKVYMKGQLRAPVKVDKKPKAAEKVLTEKEAKKVSLNITQDILYVNAEDHSYTQVIFAGEKNLYVYDISDFKKKDGGSTSYSIAVPLKGMGADTYKVGMMYQDDYYNLNKTIEISQSK